MAKREKIKIRVKIVEKEVYIFSKSKQNNVKNSSHKDMSQFLT